MHPPSWFVEAHLINNDCIDLDREVATTLPGLSGGGMVRDFVVEMILNGSVHC